MHTTPQARKRAPRALLLIALAPLLALGATAPAPALAEEGHASVAEYEQQLSSAQVASVTVNKFLARLHVTLKNGDHVLVRYGKHEEPKLVADAHAKHVPVTVLKPGAAKAEATTVPRHHKLRYIAGGILLVVIVVVGAVILNRRRKAAVE